MNNIRTALFITHISVILNIDILEFCFEMFLKQSLIEVFLLQFQKSLKVVKHR